MAKSIGNNLEEAAEVEKETKEKIDKALNTGDDKDNEEKELE